MNRTQLLQLSADLDRVIELRSDDDESHWLRNTAATVGTVGAAGVGASYLAGRNLNGPFLPGTEGALGKIGRGSARIASYAGDVGRQAASIPSRYGLDRSLASRMPLNATGGKVSKISSILEAVKGAGKAVKRFSSRHENLLTLSAELDGVIELGIMDKVRSFIPKLKDLKSGYSANRLAGAGRLDSISQSAVAAAKKLNAGGYGYMPKKQIEIPGSLSQFSAELDQVINFDFMSMVKKYGPAVGKSALKWGGIGAAGGAVAGGVSGALSDDPNKTALGGAMSGAMAGGTLGALGGAGMRGMKINSAINKAAGMKAARLAGTPGAAAAPSAAAAPTATAAADQMAAAAVQPAKVAAPMASSTNPYKQNVQYDSSAASTPPALRGSEGLSSAPTGVMDKPWNIENYKNMPQGSKKRLASAYQAGLDPRPAMSGFGEAGVGMYQKRYALSSRLQSLVQLNAELDQVIEFEDLRGKPNRKGQRPEDNMRRGIGMGILSTSPVPGLGMLAGGIEAGAYRNAGAVLRKRDVYGHEFVGGLGGVAGMGIGHAASGGNPKAAAIAGLAGWGASRYGISRRTLKKREEELKHGIMV